MSKDVISNNLVIFTTKLTHCGALSCLFLNLPLENFNWQVSKNDHLESIDITSISGAVVGHCRPNTIKFNQISLIPGIPTTSFHFIFSLLIVVDALACKQIETISMGHCANMHVEHVTE